MISRYATTNISDEQNLNNQVWRKAYKKAKKM